MSHAWKTKKISHKGFPLFLRYPENIDIAAYQGLFPNLAVVTHSFSEVQPNGLPEPEYNEGLINFDQEVRAAFEEINAGQTALIETFGGKRNYYIYVEDKVNVEKILSFCMKQYPKENLSWSVRLDPDWGFIKQYMKEFLE